MAKSAFLRANDHTVWDAVVMDRGARDFLEELSSASAFAVPPNYLTNLSILCCILCLLHALKTNAQSSNP